VIFRSSATAAVHCFIDKLFAAVALLRYFSKFFTLSAAVALLRQNFQQKFIAAEFSAKLF
jgi:hypothetical protein